jgi:hypothetical protein
MKIIKETGTSSVRFRLDKVASYATPSYIFQLQNQNSKVLTIFTSDDVSPAPLIYNEFLFVNGVSFSSTQSRFDLDSGKYFLDIYETEYNDLNIASASLLWDGELIIEGDTIPTVISFTQSDTDTTIYFEG